MMSTQSACRSLMIKFLVLTVGRFHFFVWTAKWLTNLLAFQTTEALPGRIIDIFTEHAVLILSTTCCLRPTSLAIKVTPRAVTDVLLLLHSMKKMMF